MSLRFFITHWSIPLTIHFNRLLIVLFFSLNLWIAKGEIEVRNSQNVTVEVLNDFEMSYGKPVPLEGINARLVLAQPEYACEPIAGPPKNFNDTMKWFVLIYQYPCNIRQKMSYALQAGFDGVIIVVRDPVRKLNLTSLAVNPDHNNSYNGFYDYVDPLFISPIGSTYPIQALLISNADGSLLINDYTYDKDYHVFITSNLPFDINTYLMPFVIIIGLCISVMFCFMVLQIIRCIRNHRRGNKHRLKKKYLKQIPTAKYRKGEQFDTCAICLDEYIEGEKLRVLPCGHSYHMKCIDPWLTKNRKVCPVCKGKVVLPGMSEDSDSEREAEGNEDSANERTPLINNSNSEASTSTHRLTGHRSLSRFRYIDRSTQVNPSNRNSSILTSVEADITPITLAPEHSVNCAIDSEPASESTRNNANRPSRNRQTVSQINNNGNTSNTLSETNGLSNGASSSVRNTITQSTNTNRSTTNHDIIV